MNVVVEMWRASRARRAHKAARMGVLGDIGGYNPGPDQPHTFHSGHRKRNCFIYCLGVMEELQSEGLIQAPRILTEPGRELYGVLRRSGFRISDSERVTVMAQIRHPAFYKVVKQLSDSARPDRPGTRSDIEGTRDG